MHAPDPSSTETPFSKKLDDILSKRGAAARLSEATGVPSSHISKMCKGTVLPSPEMLEQLTAPMAEADRTALAIEYLLLHRIKGAPHIRIIVSDQDPLRDRLERAIQSLDPHTRDSLASIVEAVSRSPAAGALALRSLGSWFEIAPPTPDKSAQPEPLFSSQRADNLVESPACAAPTPAQRATSTATAPAASPRRSSAAPTVPPPTAPPPTGTNTHQLPDSHWNEQTNPQPVTEPRQEVKYQPKSRRKSQ